MFLRRKVKELDESMSKSFKNVASDVNNLIDLINRANERISDTRRTVASIDKEIATNGVVRDIRDLQKRVEVLEDENEKLKTNGVATAINKLNEEVFKTRKVKKGSYSLMSQLLELYKTGDSTTPEEATLAGKVDAIIAHLGLDVTVKPEEKTEAKVVAKKVTTKKKGRR